MPIQPPPRKFVCPKCGHTKIVQPKSDALDISDFIQTCPKCKVDMKKVEMSIIDKLFDKLRP